MNNKKIPLFFPSNHANGIGSFLKIFHTFWAFCGEKTCVPVYSRRRFPVCTHVHAHVRDDKNEGARISFRCILTKRCRQWEGKFSSSVLSWKRVPWHACFYFFVFILHNNTMLAWEARCYMCIAAIFLFFVWKQNCPNSYSYNLIEPNFSHHATCKLS